MKLHQVLMAILMFKSIDWLIVAFASDPESSIPGRVAIAIVIWAFFWAVIWTAAELFMGSKFKDMIDG